MNLPTALETVTKILWSVPVREHFEPRSNNGANSLALLPCWPFNVFWPFIATLPFLALCNGDSAGMMSPAGRVKALFGFEFGGLHISLFAIFMAFILLFFVGVILLTKIFQRWLDQAHSFQKPARKQVPKTVSKPPCGLSGISSSRRLSLSAIPALVLAIWPLSPGALSLGYWFWPAKYRQ